jgi:hypothetical protein
MQSNQEYYRIASVLNDPDNYSESSWSNVLGLSKYQDMKKILIVDGIERDLGGWRGNGNAFVTLYGKALTPLNLSFESVKNSQTTAANFTLNNYSAVYWMLGDESTVNETFSASEQSAVKKYLENGGCLFVSGSEIGWDLFNKGSASDKTFYSEYLKASFVADNASAAKAVGQDSSAFSGTALNFGQTYTVGYPDVISAIGGSKACMLYSTGTTAGIQYTGKFGSSEKKGRLIYLAFPLESTANDSAFNSVIKKASSYFSSESSAVQKDAAMPIAYSLSQNYPNPFNPSTCINYSLPRTGHVSIKIYDMLGKEITTLVNTTMSAGNHSIGFNAEGCASGMYMYRIKADNFTMTKKMVLLK